MQEELERLDDEISNNYLTIQDLDDYFCALDALDVDTIRHYLEIFPSSEGSAIAEDIYASFCLRK
jgi:hypothetical protein